MDHTNFGLPDQPHWQRSSCHHSTQVEVLGNDIHPQHHVVQGFSEISFRVPGGRHHPVPGEELCAEQLKM